MGVSISRREWLIALIIALAMAALLAIPYILGYTLARPGTVFSGLVMNPEDSQSYFAKMLQGYDGNWLYTIPFTPEPHEPAFLGGFYLALGHVARWFSLSLDFAWHGARVAANLVLYLATFFFIATFLTDMLSRWTAYLLALFGSGLGWLLFALNEVKWLGAFPVDFKMPEAHLFFSALTFPHVAVGTALLLISFWLMLKAIDDDQKPWLYASLAGLSNLFLGIVYPFLILLVVVTIGLYWLYLCLRARQLLWRPAAIVALAFIVPAPLYLYYAYIFDTNELFRAWSDQALTLSPPWPHYLVSYGVMLILALLSLFRRRRQEKDIPWNFLWAWVVSAAFLVYAPLNPQRRFVQGIQVPLAILATVGFTTVVIPWLEKTRLFRWLAARPRYSSEGLVRFLVFSFILFMSISNLYLLADITLTAAVQQPYPFFRTRNELDAVAWMRANSDRSAVVLAAYETGNYVAAHAGNPVVLGHWAETFDWDQQFLRTGRFFSRDADEMWRLEFLGNNGVSYVWYGPRERKLGDFSPADAEYLSPIYSRGEVEIFEVR